MNAPSGAGPKNAGTSEKAPVLEIRQGVEREYADLFTPEARAVLSSAR